ncbi:MAG: LytTR family DNA-binding domain-containing protein [Erysipelotrichaceae bacterium]
MLKIALVDDDINCINKSSKLIEDYVNKTNVEYKLYKFNNKDVILEHGKENFDVILLDIVMPTYTGLDIAKLIRKNDPYVELALYTSSKDYALESYNLDINHYILKQNTFNLYKLLDKVIVAYNNKSSNLIILDTIDGIKKIDVNSIICVEHSFHVLIVTLTNNRIIKTRNASISLKELFELLIKFNIFIQPHRAYLVNIKYITNIENDSISLINDLMINIPRRNIKDIKKSYFDYMLGDK